MGLRDELEFSKVENLITKFFISRNNDFEKNRIYEKKYIPTDFTYQNYIITFFNSEELYSIQRFKKRNVIIDGVKTESCISTDFIVDMSHHKHNTSNSIKAMKISNDTLAAYIPGIIIGDARRALGSYLQRFDYFTIGNYFLVTIENLTRSNFGQNEFSVRSSSLRDFYRILGTLKSNAEISQSLRIQRNIESWKFISENPFINKKFHLYTFWGESELLSYLIINNENELVEYGEENNITPRIKYAILDFLSRKDISKIRLDPMNLFFKHLLELDLHINLRLLRGKGQVARIGEKFDSKNETLGKNQKNWKPIFNLYHSNLIDRNKRATNHLASSSLISDLDYF